MGILLVLGYLQMNPVKLKIDGDDFKMVQRGKPLYYAHCASCHGKDRHGETLDWRSLKPDGTFPAPPHDETGHTWHHSDQLLFDYTKKGGAQMVPKGVKSAMPAFGGKMTDEEIIAVLAYIKSRWPKEIREYQAQKNEG